MDVLQAFDVAMNEEMKRTVNTESLEARVAKLEMIVKLMATNTYYGRGVTIDSPEDKALRAFVGIDGE